jgi:hypothetical protein
MVIDQNYVKMRGKQNIKDIVLVWVKFYKQMMESYL